MLIDIKRIKVEHKEDATKRARKDFGNIFSLAKSIKQHGLLHPIVVSDCTDPDYNYVLVAGERRLRAVIYNGEENIRATLFEDMSSIERKEVELEENIVRLDLSWQEKCKMLKQLDALKRKIHGSATQAHSSEGWGIKETAEVVGMSVGSVNQDIKLAKDLEENPELVRKVERLPKHAARKIVKQELEAKVLRRQIERKELTVSADLRLGPAEHLIDELEDESVHLWLTDPPFGSAEIVKVSKTDCAGGGMPLYNLTETNVSDDMTMMKVYKELIPKVYRKLVPGAHIYVFFGHSWYTDLLRMLRDAGFIVDDSPLIWHKERVSIQAKDMHYMSSYEAIFFGHKPPTKRILTKPVPNVLSIPSAAPQMRVHPLMKPFDLLKIFIINSSNPGEVVLDTFAGSAMTLIAARKLQRSAIGFEKDEGNYLRAQKFMEKELGNG